MIENNFMSPTRPMGWGHRDTKGVPARRLVLPPGLGLSMAPINSDSLAAPCSFHAPTLFIPPAGVGLTNFNHGRATVFCGGHG